MGRKIAVEIVGDAASLEKAYRRATRDTEKFNRDVSHAGRTGAGGFGVLGKVAGAAAGLTGIGGLVEAVKGSYEEMTQQQRAAAQTGAVLKSTGGAAGVSAKHVDELATSLAGISGVQDDVIQSGENMLLTFTSVRNQAGKGNDIYDQSTRTLLDMSTALGEDMPKAAIQLGKALNDPIHGVTALRRVGVQFTDGQRKQIKAMVDSGNTMGAQKLILRELNREFGGSAKAAGETLPGRLNILKNTFFNLGATLLKDLSPQITQVANKMIAWLSNTQNQKQIIDIFRGAIRALRTGVHLLHDGFGLLSKVMGGNKNAVEFLIGAYSGFRILAIANRVIRLANNFATLATTLFTKAIPATQAETVVAGEATVATEGLAIALGPAVLVAGALAAGAALGTLLMQIKPVRDAMVGLAGDIASVFGYKNPMDQFKGTQVTQTNIGMAQQAAIAMERRGVSAADTARALAFKFPTLARRDLEVAAGVYRPTGSAVPTINIGNLHINGVQDPGTFQDQLLRRARRMPQVR